MPRKRKNGAAASDAAAETGATAIPNVTPALIAEAVAQYVVDRSTIARAAARCAANLARYEAQGVEPEWVKETAKEMKFTAQEAAARNGMRTKYLLGAGIISLADAEWTAKVKQSDMELAPKGDAAEKVRYAGAKAHGYRAGRKGHSLDSNPYSHQPGSPEFIGWRDGLQEGLDDRKDLKPGSENVVQASTQRKRREPAAEATEDATAPEPTHPEPSTVQ